MAEIKTFGRPTQVLFYNSSEVTYNRGIAFGTEVICACCGRTIPLKQVCIEAEEDGVKDILPLSWIDISDAICPDECYKDYVNEDE